MNQFAKEIRFPLNGLGKAAGFRSYEPGDGSAPFTTDCVNVWGRDTFLNRVRGGSRPGLAPFTDDFDGHWFWPNGEEILWSDNGTMPHGLSLATLDGVNVVDPHQKITATAAKGDIPAESKCTSYYRARLVISSGAAWYASASGDYTNFDYGDVYENVGRAVAGNVGLADRKGDEITCIAAVEDTRLYIATQNGLWVYNGDLTTGERVCISPEVGIVGPSAWTWNGNSLYFLSPRGIYRLTPGQELAPVSTQLPDGLRNASADTTLCFDPEYEGVHIINAGDGFTYFMETSGAIWPETFAEAGTVPVACVRTENRGVRKVIFRCADGEFRHFERGEDDDGAEVASRVTLGPVRLSRHDSLAAVTNFVTAIFATNSAPVKVTVRTADSAETCLAGEGDEFWFMAGWQQMNRCRLRGAWCSIELESTGQWAYESIGLRGATFRRYR